MEKFLDKTGREYKIGDYFVGAFRIGDNAAMKIGRIVGYGDRKLGYPTRTVPTLKMRTVEDRYSFTPTALCRMAVMECPERACIVPADILPRKHRELLDPLVDASTVCRLTEPDPPALP